MLGVEAAGIIVGGQMIAWGLAGSINLDVAAIALTPLTGVVLVVAGLTLAAVGGYLLYTAATGKRVYPRRRQGARKHRPVPGRVRLIPMAVTTF